MIRNIPEKDEFLQFGLEYIHLAYEGVLNLVHALREYDPDGEYLERGDQEEYWDNAKGKLMIYTSLSHQGIDFILKSKVANVSPFLLLENNPDRYPKKKDGVVDYSDFFSIESSKLLKLVDYVTDEEMTDEFKTIYERNRQRRNKIMHTVDNKLELVAEEIMKEIIFSTIYLTSESWFKGRLNFLESKETYSLYGSERGLNESNLLVELSLLQDILKPAEFKKVFGIPKSSRLYLCPDCHHSDYNHEFIGSCFLSPNSRTSQNMHCLICDSDFEISREECSENNCPSNVLVTDTGTCGLCWG